MPTTVKLFVSHSHADARYLESDSLLGFLRGLEKEGGEFWSDRKIATGELWDDAQGVVYGAIQPPAGLVLHGFLLSVSVQLRI